MTERMRITADGMTISRDKDGNVQWIQVEGVTLVRKQRAEKAEQTIKEISEVMDTIGGFEEWCGKPPTDGDEGKCLVCRINAIIGSTS